MSAQTRKKVMTVVGARPQFVKLSAVATAFAGTFDHVIVHTGQHYDDAMSRVFFDDLVIPEPRYNLGVGSGTHAAQTGAIMTGLEEVMVRERPDLAVVYGDTNSTVAAALVAAKLTTPLAHIEAGLRSFNRSMPEEINRIIADRVSDYLFCPTPVAMANLAREGLAGSSFLVGDVMLDALMLYLPAAERRASILEKLGVKEKSYYLATVHRAANTDRSDTLRGIIQAFSKLDHPVILPPSTPGQERRCTPQGMGKGDPANIRVIEPVGYLDMLMLEKHARKILTDSGGVQKEAYCLQVPCITLRDETEWVETTIDGWNVLAGTDALKIVEAARHPGMPARHTRQYGDGDAGKRILAIIREKIA